MATEKQMAANRRNAAKSTGPRTRAGKMRASGNALKLGLLAQSVVVRGQAVRESAWEYEKLCLEFHERLAPVGLLEEMLTGQIAATTWRLRRVRQAEAGEIALSVDEGARQRSEPNPDEMFPKWGWPNDPVPEMEKTALGNAIITSWLADVYKVVEETGKLPEEAVKIPCSGKPNEISDELEEMRKMVPARPGDMDAGEYREGAKQLVLMGLEGMMKRRERMRVECERRERQEERVRQAAAVLPGEAALARITRYEAQLEKQLFRAMNQLEKLQERRGEKLQASKHQHPEKLLEPSTFAESREVLADGHQKQKNAKNEISQNEPNSKTQESPDLTGVKG